MNLPNKFRLTLKQTAALTVDSGPWLSCDECFELIDQYVQGIVDGTLISPTLEAVSGHLQGCAACAEDVQTLICLITADVDATSEIAPQPRDDVAYSSLNRDDSQ
jgi:anti-sigma factor RsiW